MKEGDEEPDLEPALGRDVAQPVINDHWTRRVGGRAGAEVGALELTSTTWSTVL